MNEAIQSLVTTSVSLVPPADLAEYAALPDDVRSEFRLLAAALPAIRSAKSAFSVLGQIAPSLGKSPKTLYGRVRKYDTTGDWRSLINRAKAGPAQWKMTDLYGVPAATIELYRALCERNQRVDIGGHRELVAIWKTHRDADGRYYERIPGYRDWPEANPRTGLPAGWSYENLQRLAKAHPYDQAANRIGLFAASQYRPPVITTRVGLRFFERIQFDDHEYNVKIHFPGQWRAMRPRGFNSIEALSACTFAKSFKPTLWDMADEKKKILNERDMMWFTVHVLTDFGYRNDETGTTFVVEHGTAAIRAAFLERITNATRGHVKLALSSMFGAAPTPGQFDGRGRGNFKHKALIESSFNMVDNYFARLPAQTGLDRNTFPDDTYGREEYFRNLLKDIEAMPPERAADAELPLLTWQGFLDKAMDLYEAMNTNPDHNLEGWEQLGFILLEWRPSEQSPWIPKSKLLALPPEDRALVQQALEPSATHSQAPVLTRARKLSRQEVFNAHRGELTQVPAILWPELLGLENGRELTVTKHGLFEFDDADMGPETFRYLAATKAVHFLPGEKYLCFVNPWSPRRLVACKANGGVVGLCEWWDAPCHNDVEQIKRQMGRQAHWQAQRDGALAARHLPEAKDRTHLLAHNAAVKAAAAGRVPSPGAPVTAEARDAMHTLLEPETPATDTAEASSTNNGLDFIEAIL